MENKAGTAVKPSEIELERQLEYIRAIRKKNDAFEAANGRKKKSADDACTFPLLFR